MFSIACLPGEGKAFCDVLASICGNGLDIVAVSSTVRKPCSQTVPLAPPIPLRLSKEQLDWLDQWRGSTLSRSAAIRVLINQVIRSNEAHQPR
jgi:hypothetical protein